MAPNRSLSEQITALLESAGAPVTEQRLAEYFAPRSGPSALATTLQQMEAAGSIEREPLPGGRTVYRLRAAPAEPPHQAPQRATPRQPAPLMEMLDRFEARVTQSQHCIWDAPLKREVLLRLARIVEPEIGCVLEAIASDIERLEAVGTRRQSVERSPFRGAGTPAGR